MRGVFSALLLCLLYGNTFVLAADLRVSPDPLGSRAGSLLRLLEGSRSPSGTTTRSSVRTLARKAAALGTYEYEPMAIEPIGGKTRTRVHGINNLGQVAGRSFNFDDVNQQAVERTAFIWDPLTGARALPTLSGESSAWGLNNAGQASGFANDAAGLSHAVRWETGSMTVLDLGTLVNATTGQAGTTSAAYELGDLGDVTGESDIPSDDGQFMAFHGFRYSDAGGLLDLGTFDTLYPEYQHGYSISYGVNRTGQVVGTAQYTASGNWLFRPFIHDAAGGLRQLPVDSARDTGEWYAVAINDSGVIGGDVIIGTNQSLPYYWTSEAAQPVALTMSAAYPYGEIYGIASQGTMVGIMWNDAQEERAFIFDSTNGVRDLNALIDPSLGWTLTFARDINDSGQIVGGGLVNGQARGFLLSPWALTGRIDGSVRRTGTTEPLAGVTVRVYTATGALVAQASTDSLGHYVIALVPGTYFAIATNTLGGADQLYAGRRCTGCDPTTGNPLNVAAGATVPNVDFSLDSPPSLSIRDAVVKEGDSGQTTVTFTITLSKPGDTPVTVDFATSGQ